MDPEDEKNTNPEDKGTEGEKPKTSPEDGLPQWAKDELSRVRREAARYRTERNNLKEQFKDAKTPEEFQAAIDEYEEKVRQSDLKALRADVARKHSLPDTLASRLQGDTEEALIEDAMALSEFASSNPGKQKQPDAADLKGGLNPNDKPEQFDAAAAAQRILEQY